MTRSASRLATDFGDIYIGQRLASPQQQIRQPCQLIARTGFGMRVSRSPAGRLILSLVGPKNYWEYCLRTCSASCGFRVG